MNALPIKQDKVTPARAGYKSRAPLSRHPEATLRANVVQRKASCACGGGCPSCQRKGGTNLRISAPNEPAEIEADRIADQVMRMPSNPGRSVESERSSPAAIRRQCLHRQHEAQDLTSMRSRLTIYAPIANAFGSGGQALDSAARAFFEPRFGADFSAVRIHTGTSAENSSAALDAKAYTLGSDIAFAKGEYRPTTEAGKRLLAHELAHVVQQGVHPAQALQRTPANKVSCANHTPLIIPGTGVSIADPVAVITAAEDRANEMFDQMISALEFTRQRILDGAPAAWPTISDALAQGLVLMGLDPDDSSVWTAPNGTGRRSVTLLLRRLRLIRSTIGAGSFFFFCLGTGRTTLGGCAVTSGDICTGAVLTTCAGEFLTAMCPGFWSLSAENQAARIVHESAHNFATFIGHTGRFTNAECFARLVQVYAGVPVAEQRTDLCPDP